MSDLMSCGRADAPHILFVTKKLVMGGAEHHLAQLLPALASRGFGVELFVLERGGELEVELAKADVTISGLPRRSGRLTHLLAAAIELHRRIRQSRPDILHFFLPEPYLIGAVVAAFARHRACVMSRRSLAHYQRNHPWFGRIERFLHRRMTALLGNSQAVVDELIAEGADRRKTGLIHNGVTLAPPVDASVRATQRTALSIPDDAFVMVIVANLFHYKGHADLFDALGEIASRLPQPWRLLVIGRDEGEGPELRLQAERLGIADKTLWLGERFDVQALLPAVDVALLVSHQEGFSNALIEAMGHGLPVVATAVGGNLDAVVDGKTGLLVAPRNPAALGTAILSLASDPSRSRQIGLAARERTLAMFSQDACLDRYERLYRHLNVSSDFPIQTIIDGRDLPPPGAD